MKEKCLKCGSTNILMIEYGWPFPLGADYDGISEIKCNDCGARTGRWSGKILKKDEFERRYGGKPVKL